MPIQRGVPDGANVYPEWDGGKWVNWKNICDVCGEAVPNYNSLIGRNDKVVCHPCLVDAVLFHAPKGNVAP